MKPIVLLALSSIKTGNLSLPLSKEGLESQNWTFHKKITMFWKSKSNLESIHRWGFIRRAPKRSVNSPCLREFINDFLFSNGWMQNWIKSRQRYKFLDWTNKTMKLFANQPKTPALWFSLKMRILKLLKRLKNCPYKTSKSQLLLF
jgi:hypothetical protein